MRIIIRADGGTVVGSGHIMRCLTLAEELKANGQVIFASRELPGNIAAIVEVNGYRIKLLPAELDKANTEFLDFLKQEQVDILIIDNYDTGIDLEIKSRDFVGCLVVIDDLADKRHDCDILLNQNPLPVAHARYEHLIPRTAITLLGLSYALLRKEFLQRKKIEKEVVINNVLIFFGGGDHLNLTEKILDTIIRNRSELSDHLRFDVVVGNANPNKEKIRYLCESQKNFVYHCQVNNMAQIMHMSDLYIGAGGTTNWERMCVGLPAIIISIAENQEDVCHELDKMEVIKYLSRAEEFSSDQLLSVLKWIQENQAWYQRAAAIGKEMVDGEGVKRVAASITSLLMTLRKAEASDCSDVYGWRYTAENLRYSFNKEKITFDQHKEWFDRTVISEDKDLLIIHLKHQPIGVVRFDYKESQVAEISLYLVPGQHNKGYGLPALFAAERWLQGNRKDITTIHAKVIEGNEASRKIFERALYGKKPGRTIAYY